MCVAARYCLGMEASSWPVYEADTIAVLNPLAPVALSVLWRRMDTIVPRLTEPQRRGLVAVGNLYSKDGINLMLRNILAKPTIRRVLVTGPDLSGSGDALLKLVRDGVGEDRTIVGTIGAKVDREISDDAIARFRANVDVVDLRQGFDLGAIDSYFLDPAPAWAEPELFAERTLETPEFFPCEQTGVQIRGRKIAEVWLEVLHHVMRFGVVKGTEYGNRMRELVNVMTVVEDEDTLEPKLQPELPFTKDELQDYYERTLTAVEVPNVAYTYGQRLRAFGEEKIDQVAYILQKLREQPNSRRALASTWDQRKDPPDSNPPCLDLVQATIQEGRLFLTVYLRSNDMYASWHRNAFAMRELQRKLSEELGVKQGPLTMLSQSAHIYENDWEPASKALEQFRSQKLALTDMDPRGSFIISLDREAGEIVVLQQTPEGERLAEYRERSAEKLIRQLDHVRAISVVSHATYIGMEIGRAEICLRKGIEYIQDRAPSL